MMFAMFVVLMPVSLGMFFGSFALEGIAAGMAAGPAVSIMLMYGYVRLIRKEKLFDYTLLHLEDKEVQDFSHIKIKGGISNAK